MKNFLFLFSLSFALISCSRYNQIYYAHSFDGKVLKQKGYFVFENDTVKISYVFWDNLGSMNFTVYNKLSMPIYIDWKKSSFIGNGEKKNYYEDITNNSAQFGSITSLLNASTSSATGTSSGFSVKAERITFLPPNSYVSKTTNYHLTSGYLKVKKGMAKEILIDKKKCYEETFEKAKATILFRNYLTYSSKETFDDER